MGKGEARVTNPPLPMERRARRRRLAQSQGDSALWLRLPKDVRECLDLLLDGPSLICLRLVSRTSLAMPVPRSYRLDLSSPFAGSATGGAWPLGTHEAWKRELVGGLACAKYFRFPALVLSQRGFWETGDLPGSVETLLFLSTRTYATCESSGAGSPTTCPNIIAAACVPVDLNTWPSISTLACHSN